MKATVLMEFCELKQLTAAQRPHIYSKEEENGAKILINQNWTIFDFHYSVY